MTKLGYCVNVKLKIEINCFQIDFEFANVGFRGGRKTRVPEDKPSEQGRQATTISTQIWRQHRKSNPGHIGGRRMLSPPRHPRSTIYIYSGHKPKLTCLSRFFLLSKGTCRKRTTSNYCCVFPFIYKGRRYHSCTTKNSKLAWCALTPNYDRDKKFGYCTSKSFSIY